MINFIFGFFTACCIFALLIFGHIKNQENLQYQINLIKKDNSSSLVKSNSSFFTKDFINSINGLIEELLTQKKGFQDTRQNFKDMATTISHDFRTPLTSISGYVQVLKQDKTLSEDSKEKYLNIIEKRAISLSALIEDFYTTSAIDSGDYQFTLSSISLTQSLKEVIANYYFELEKVYSYIKIDIDEQNYYIMSDKISLERVFSNLLKNSFLYGKNKIEISLKQEKNSYVVRIANEKPKNMSNKSLKEIFDRNYSLNWKDGNKSTGLGLSIAKKLTEKSRGNIDARFEGDMIVFELTFSGI